MHAEPVTDSMLSEVDCHMAHAHYKLQDLEEATICLNRASTRVMTPYVNILKCYMEGLVQGIKGMKNLQQSKVAFQGVINGIAPYKDGVD